MPLRHTKPVLNIQWDPDLIDDAKRGGYDTAVQGALEDAVDRASGELGIALDHPISVHIYAPKSYERAFGAVAASRRWAHYQNRQIHVNGGIAIDASFAGLLTHEMTHAVLDAYRNGGQFATWMNEGLARLLENESTGRGAVDDVQRLFLKDAQRGHDIKTLTQVRAPLDANGYLESFAAVSLLMQRYSRPKVIQFYRSLSTGRTTDQAWRALGTDEASFAKVFDAWVAEYRSGYEVEGRR